jgi:signal peptidase I
MLNDLQGTPDQTGQRAGEQPWRPQSYEQPEDGGGVGGTIRELVETVLFILLIFFIVRGLVQNFRIEGPSMEPNLHSDQ